MRRAIVLALVMALAVGSLSAAEAAKKKKPITFYLHGTSHAGEADLQETWLASAWHTMDEKEPDGAAPKSMFVTNYLVGPNPQCSGNGLLPTWKGEFRGKVKGNIKVLLHTISSPAAQLSVELYADAVGGCTQESLGVDDYVPPVAEAVVTPDPGHAETEVLFENVKFKAEANITLMLHIVGPSPAQVRVLYDSPDMASSVELFAKK